MQIPYSFSTLVAYLLLYSFIGWAAETIYIAVQQRRYYNRGILNLPLSIPHGISAVLLLIGLPHLENMGLQYLLCLAVLHTVHSLCGQFVRGLTDTAPAPHHPVGALLLATVYLTIYLVVHPFAAGLVELLPRKAVTVIALSGAVITAVDFLCVLYALRTKQIPVGGEFMRLRTNRLNLRMAIAIRDRLNHAYPGIMTPDPDDDGDHIFAHGICLDKLMWVFLISSFLGAIIEMVYCRLYGGVWMNRSSLLYGSFSVVWGIGAVVLTVALQNLAGKPDRHVFMGGFFIGGAYEYLCSIVTELVFGTVFWDYSHMPLNIGGRTNVVYCIFWGILAVVWLKLLYPRMSSLIERIPAVQGKIVTWALVVVMACDCLLTAGAMIRYNTRQTDPTPANFIEEYFDSRYDDSWMESRWPNMKPA